MKINELAPAEGAVTASKRLGRGTGSGLGKTAGKGHKGQWARSGGGVRPAFEGGQIPLHRRLPKIGFKNAFKKNYTLVNVGALECFEDGAVVSVKELLLAGVICEVAEYGVKILNNGTLTKKLTVQAHKFSQAAKEAIEKCGGTVEVI